MNIAPHPQNTNATTPRASGLRRGLHKATRLISLLVLAATSASQAATITVNSNADPAGFNPAITISGLGPTVTLRDAVNAANNTAGDDTIVFDAALGGQTIVLSQVGIVDSSGGTGNSALQTIGSGGALAINGATANGGVTLQGGGGMRALLVRNMSVDLQNLTFTGFTGAQGGAIHSVGNLTIQGCTFHGNTGTMTGGAIRQLTGSLAIKNSTFHNNFGILGGALFVDAPLTLENATIVGNILGNSGNGGAVFLFGATTANNTIIAGNKRQDNAPSDVFFSSGSFQAGSRNNLIGTGGAGGLVHGVDGNQVGVTNPGVAALANNGGPTRTMALQPGSPAINAGIAVAGITTDQRGMPRPLNGTPDIGAFEVGTAAAITSAPAFTFFSGFAESFTVTATGQPAPTITTTSALPSGVTLIASGLLSGTPAPGSAGVYPIELVATSLFSTPATQSFTLTVIDGTWTEERAIFHGDGSGWTPNSTNPAGRPSFSSDVLTLTTDTAGLTNSTWFRFEKGVTAFDSNWVYQASSAGTLADGFAFVLQNAAAGTGAIGGAGGGLGYEGIGNSFAVLFNLSASAPGGRGIQLGFNGARQGNYLPTGSVDLGSGNPIEVSLRYSAGLLKVRLFDIVAHTNFTIDFPVNIPGRVGGDTALVGFTGATGGSSATQTFSEFSYTALAPGDFVANKIHHFNATGSVTGLSVNFDGALDDDLGLVEDGGFLYGAAGSRGPESNGAVFRVRPDGSEFQVIYNFPRSNDLSLPAPSGDGPDGPLVISGGVLYGTTELGGSGEGGTVFRMNTNGTGFQVLHHFSTAAGGWQPNGVALSGATLYGTTQKGGNSDHGTIFRISTDGTGFQVLHQFSGTDGSEPRIAPTLDGSTLYGVTPRGGAAAAGVVYKIQTDGTAFSVVHEFAGGANGEFPYEKLVISGGTLYGAGRGGSAGEGVVYKVNTDGTGFSLLWNFTGGNGGSTPTTGLTILGNMLYGGTAAGGTGDKGILYQIDTTGANFQVLHSFAGDAAGGRAYGSPLLSGGSIFIGCLESRWGTFGAITRIDTDGSDYSVLHHFSAGTSSSRRLNIGGTYPGNPLLVADGKLFGAAMEGGRSGGGTLFQLGLAGENFSVLKNFVPGFGGGGYEPKTGLTLSGGVLYGTTARTDSSSGGAIFKMNPDGSGFTLLHQLDPGPDGREPKSELIVAGDTIYGTTSESSTPSNRGAVFKLKTDGTGFTVLHRFLQTVFPDSPDGAAPDGQLVLIGNTLYGTAPRGGSSGNGTIYKINTDGTGFAVLHHATDRSPSGLLLHNGALYGLASIVTGGPDSAALYRINPDGTGYQVLHTFNGGTNGRSPEGPLVHSNGAFYSTVFGTYPTDPGGVFRVNIDGTGFELLHCFLGNDRPEDGVVVHQNRLYGTCRYGGRAGTGFVFSMPPLESPGLTVTTAEDVTDMTDGVTSLREALAYAATFTGPQTVTFAPALTASGPATLTLTMSGYSASYGPSAFGVTNNSNITVQGPTGANGITLNASGGGDRRHFFVEAGSTLTVSNLTFTGGRSTQQGASIGSFGALSINGCTFTGNISTQEGGAVHCLDGATSLVVTNSTFAGNSAASLGSALVSGANSNTLTNVTIVDNTSGANGGAFWLYERSATMINTVIARNLGGGSPSDVTFWGAAAFTAQSTHNLIGPGGAGNLVNGVNGNLTGVANGSLLLGTLANNGGPTATVAPLPGSPLIDAGTAVAGVTTDQRGLARPSGFAPDIGAFEYVPPPTALASWRALQGLAADGSQDLANPSGDGVANLLKFAFNMAPNAGDLLVSNTTVLPSGGSAGLPLVTVDATPRLHFQFVRRKAATNPGILYLAETSEDLSRWTALDLGTATIESINGIWERVTVSDPVSTPRRFGRVSIMRIGPYFNDFNAGLGAATLRGTAVWTNQAVQLTDTIGGQLGAVVFDGIATTSQLSGFAARFTMNLGPAGQPVPADGINFAVGDLGTGAWGESGPATARNLAVGFDTYNNGGTGNIGIHLWANGTHIAASPVNPFTNGATVPVEIRYDAASGVTVKFNGTTIFSNIALPGFSLPDGGRFGIGARTGGFAERAVVDDIEISPR